MLTYIYSVRIEISPNRCQFHSTHTKTSVSARPPRSLLALGRGVRVRRGAPRRLVTALVHGRRHGFVAPTARSLAEGEAHSAAHS